jgi:hypothetical protein
MRSRCCLCVCARACVCICPQSLLGKDSVIIPLSLLGNGSVKNPLTVARRNWPVGLFRGGGEVENAFTNLRLIRLRLILPIALEYSGFTNM